ncbi:gpW family head-tail joining protein [Sphingomonas zeae]
MRFNRSTSLLAGMDDTVLRARLAQMQQDYLDLSAGRKLQSAAYAQGDGSKTVSYTQATLGNLTAAIRQLQAQLGIISTPRSALRPRF